MAQGSLRKRVNDKDVDDNKEIQLFLSQHKNHTYEHTVVITICTIFGKLKQDQIPTWIGEVGRKSHL